MILDGCEIRRFVDLVYENAHEGVSVAEVGVWQGETSIHWVPIVARMQGTAYLVDWFQGCEGHQGSPARRSEVLSNLQSNLGEIGLSDFSKMLVRRQVTGLSA